MFDYSLATKLKEAGFPHNWSEACGDKFEGLRRVVDSDIKTDYIWFADREKYTSEGRTAEEAVANLWLALNKK